MRVKRTIAIVAIAAIGMASADSLGAQPYPDHPITVVYPFASGGSGDSILRSVSDKLSETLGQPIVIESRPGAGTTVGAKSVSRSSPNGYTLLCATNATLVIAPAIYPNAGYNPGTDFTPIGMIGHAASVLVVRPSFPARSQ